MVSSSNYALITLLLRYDELRIRLSVWGRGWARSGNYHDRDLPAPEATESMVFRGLCLPVCSGLRNYYDVAAFFFGSDHGFAGCFEQTLWITAVLGIACHRQ